MCTKRELHHYLWYFCCSVTPASQLQLRKYYTGRYCTSCKYTPGLSWSWFLVRRSEVPDLAWYSSRHIEPSWYSWCLLELYFKEILLILFLFLFLILLVTPIIPRWTILSTHRSGLPHNVNCNSSLGFCNQAMHSFFYKLFLIRVCWKSQSMIWEIQFSYM